MDIKEKLKKEIWKEIQKELRQHNPKEEGCEPAASHLFDNDADDGQRTSTFQNFDFIESISDTAVNISVDQIMQGKYTTILM